jgi:hypothetical protein
VTATLEGIFFDPAHIPTPICAKELPTTDIKLWLKDNRPRNYAELKDLRQALYQQRTHGQYVVEERGCTYAGEEKFTVTGRESTLLIVSNKSRHFLLRTLCRLVKSIR